MTIILIIYFCLFRLTVLPPPLSGTPNNGINSQQQPHQQQQQQYNSNINRNKFRPINLRDLFIAPPFDELDAVAMDGTGEPRRLTNSQLRSLRDRG